MAPYGLSRLIHPYPSSLSLQRHTGNDRFSGNNRYSGLQGPDRFFRYIRRLLYYIPFLASTPSGQALILEWHFELTQHSLRGLNLPRLSLPELMRRKDIKIKRNRPRKLSRTADTKLECVFVKRIHFFL